MAELHYLRFSPLKNLSAGQHQRLAFSVFFQCLSDFLIFDENLAFADQQFIQKCEGYFKEICNSHRTVIFVSHDLPFLRKFCKTAIWLDEGRIRLLGEIDKVLGEYEKFFQP
jgi:ABC-type polysaccharide/polyol phosphate transport system ATPase subunit